MKPGEINHLIAITKTEHGMYLAESKSAEEKVLLPRKYVQNDLKPSDEIDVFLYRDSADRLIATTKTPKIMMHQIARLTVSDVGKIGAFVDWGLEKDLLLPFKEQTKKVEKGEEVLVALYLDKTGRLALTMNVYPYLESSSPYQKEDTVRGTVYQTSKNFGAFVAVDDRYSALIPKKELVRDLAVSEKVEARVIAVLEDGRLTLGLRKKSYEQIGEDAEKILKDLKASGGSLPFNDKADPEKIREHFGMSKAEFKRALGKLYKERLIVIGEDSVTLTQK